MLFRCLWRWFSWWFQNGLNNENTYETLEKTYETLEKKKKNYETLEKNYETLEKKKKNYETLKKKNYKKQNRGMYNPLQGLPYFWT